LKVPLMDWLSPFCFLFEWTRLLIRLKRSIYLGELLELHEKAFGLPDEAFIELPLENETKLPNHSEPIIALLSLS
jgi:hypothetical protein